MINDIKKIKKITDIHQILTKYNKNENVCEIGVRKGNNLARLLSTNPKVLIGIDIWKDDEVKSRNDSNFSQRQLEDQYQFTLNRFSKFPNVTIIRDYSFNAVRNFKDEYFDYVFIDADHSYTGVKQDIDMWYPKVKQGGIFAGHDYDDQFPGVEKAVHEFIKEKNIDNLHITSEASCKSWIIVKNTK